MFGCMCNSDALSKSCVQLLILSMRWLLWGLIFVVIISLSSLSISLSWHWHCNCHHHHICRKSITLFCPYYFLTERSHNFLLGLLSRIGNKLIWSFWDAERVTVSKLAGKFSFENTRIFTRYCHPPHTIWYSSFFLSLSFSIPSQGSLPKLFCWDYL